jgi:hypothetical protein
MGTILLLLGIVLLYFLPSIISGVRNTEYFGGIFALNLFLGWTFIGWVGALIWAGSAPEKDKKTYEPYSKKDYKPYTKSVDMTSDEALTELKRDKDKLDLGLITQEKYDSLKTELSKYIK